MLELPDTAGPRWVSSNARAAAPAPHTSQGLSLPGFGLAITAQEAPSNDPRENELPADPCSLLSFHQQKFLPFLEDMSGAEN